jgi:hypothetical protein
MGRCDVRHNSQAAKRAVRAPNGGGSESAQNSANLLVKNCLRSDRVSKQRLFSVFACRLRNL